jgi:hypothetical protein
MRRSDGAVEVAQRGKPVVTVASGSAVLVCRCGALIYTQTPHTPAVLRALDDRGERHLNAHTTPHNLTAGGPLAHERSGS